MKKIIILSLQLILAVSIVGCARLSEKDSERLSSHVIKEEYRGKPSPCIIETIYETDDVVIADVVATDPLYGADNTGLKDSTKAIQLALNHCQVNGGGTVWLPAGKYKITSSITIPSYTTLRGDWQDPDAGNEYGTVIMAQPASIDSEGPALFYLGGSAGVKGLTIYYPEQDINNVKPYPFTFYVSGRLPGGYMLQSIINCTVINGYQGIGACLRDDLGEIHEMMTVDTFKGTFLKTGAEIYNQADVGTWKNITISNKYWVNASPDLKAVNETELNKYTLLNSTGLILGDLEWTQFANLKIDYCKTGINIVKGKRIEFAGSLFDVSIDDCMTGVLVDSIDERWGMLIARSNISGESFSIKNNTAGTIKLADVSLEGKIYGDNIVRDYDSLSHLTIDYNKTPHKPGKNLFVVSADISGKEDSSEVIQESLDKAAGYRGGIVYLPAGKYLLTKPLIVPANVELRGVSGVAQRETTGLSKGTIVLAKYGESSNPDISSALIMLKGKNAGVRGLRIFYKDNNFMNGVKKYGYAIRGKASGVYVINVAITAAYNGIDFRECDNHIINKLVGCAYNNMINAGGQEGHIEGCLQNGNSLYRNGLSISGWPYDESRVFVDLFDPILRVRSEFLRLSDASGQIVLNVFAYGTKNLIVSTNSTNTCVFNIGADNLGSNTPLLKLTGGSLTGINIMRWNGKSYTNKGGKLTLYNRITINDISERTVK